MRSSKFILLLSTLCLGSPLAPGTPPTEVLLLPTSALSSPSDVLAIFTSALETLQTRFFSPTTGTYPTGINWTRAVLGTLLSASTSTLSSNPSTHALSDRYLAQTIAFYYGQDATGLKTEAYDDILWVVLQWLEATKTLDLRATTFPADVWTGAEWKPVFAARAKEFYELAEKGWDETLCRGGMVWSPWLEPYKNAITNELFVAASAGMYLFHPDHDARHLENAKMAHSWLKSSGMQNVQGLYTDGFHISKLLDPPEAGEKVCDKRDEMVYTYNQGVLLSGLRGLSDATGERGYLEEGFELIDAVVGSEGKVGEIVKSGILTEKCDPESYCSQNGHTFKGIFMHHLTLFCSSLSPLLYSAAVTSWHAESCSQYHEFIRRNAAAAWSTRNADGVIGAWWGAPDAAGEEYSASPFWVEEEGRFKSELDEGATDWRNPRGGEVVGERVDGDLNDRGRGRTVESHSGGLAAVRAVLEVVG